MDFFVDGLNPEDCETIAQLMASEAKDGQLTRDELLRCKVMSKGGELDLYPMEGLGKTNT